MTKFSKILVIICAIVLLSTVFAGCQSFKWGPIGDSDSQADVIGNGGLAVRQGKYLYYINGQDNVASILKSKDNYFGNASVKGSIMKSTIKEDGSLDETAVVVPKMFMTTYTNGGIFVYEDWIYYTSTSTKTDNMNNVQTDDIEYLRTKTDGTKTQSIAIVTGQGTNYYFAKDCLIYFESNTLTKVPYSNSKIGKKQIIDEDISACTFTKGSDVIFYTKGYEADSAESKKYSNNLCFVVTSTTDKAIVCDEKTFSSGQEPTLKQQKTITILKYDNNENSLYFAAKNNDAEASEATFGVKLADDYTFASTDVKKFSNAKLTAFIPLGIDNGLFDVSAAKTFVLKQISEDAFVDEKQREIEFSATISFMFFDNVEDNEYMYYSLGKKVYRMNTTNGQNFQEEIFSDNFSLAWLGFSKIGDFVYFINTQENSYLYRFDYTQYNLTNNNVTMPKAYIVSGYEASDKTDDGLIPKFMTEKDKETYISAHPIKKD